MPNDYVENPVQAHSAILEQYAEVNLDLAAGKAFSRSETLAAMKDWIVDHIVSHDIGIRDFILNASDQIRRHFIACHGQGNRIIGDGWRWSVQGRPHRSLPRSSPRPA